ncbi:MAG: hypothetical protein AB8C84_03265 [Oligoflexales bacterium]
MKHVLWVVGAMFVVGCDLVTSWMYEDTHGSMSAEQVVEAYLTTAFNLSSVDEKHLLMKFTGGKLKAALAGATEETMKKAYVDARYQLQSFSILDRVDRTPRVTEITFLLTYQDLPDGETDFAKAPTIETENTLMLEKEEGLWLITDVLGQKSLFDFPETEDSEIKGSLPAGEPSSSE